jgi:Xaa-Pro aminopeptidase
MKTSLPLIQSIRAIKNSEEISNIKEAQAISEYVLLEAVKKLKTGVTEIEIAEFIISLYVKKGIKALAFDPIVAFGKGSADIHHVPGKNKLKKGDIVMFDIGATFNGYCSDMSRTYFFGEPNDKQKKMYSAVLEAQEKVLDAIKKGERNCGKLDAVARKFLNKKFGKGSFPHGLGHGVGTVIHEWPSFRPESKDILLQGMVMTVEPGIYIKGIGGVRIEDMILIAKNGFENLTFVDKNLPIISIEK